MPPQGRGGASTTAVPGRASSHKGKSGESTRPKTREAVQDLANRLEGWKVIDTGRRQGECFFEAVSYAVHGARDEAGALREVVASHLAGKDYSSFMMVEEGEKAAAWKEYQRLVALSGTWADRLTVSTMSVVMGRRICVFAVRDDVLTLSCFEPGSRNEVPDTATLWLGYVEGHYVCAVKGEDSKMPTTTAYVPPVRIPLPIRSEGAKDGKKKEQGKPARKAIIACLAEDEWPVHVREWEGAETQPERAVYLVPQGSERLAAEWLRGAPAATVVSWGRLPYFCGEEAEVLLSTNEGRGKTCRRLQVTSRNGHPAMPDANKEEMEEEEELEEPETCTSELYLVAKTSLDAEKARSRVLTWLRERAGRYLTKRGRKRDGVFEVPITVMKTDVQSILMRSGEDGVFVRQPWEARDLLPVLWLEGTTLKAALLFRREVCGWGLTFKKSGKSVVYGVRVPKAELDTARRVLKDRHADLKVTATAATLLDGEHYEVQGVPSSMNGLELEDRLKRSGWPVTVRKRLHRFGEKQSWAVTSCSKPRGLVLNVQGTRWTIQPLEGDLQKKKKNKKGASDSNKAVFTLPPNAIWGRQAGQANPSSAPTPAPVSDTQASTHHAASTPATHSTPVAEALPPPNAPAPATKTMASVDAFEEWARKKELEHEQERKAMEARVVDMERKAAATISLVKSMEQNMQALGRQMEMVTTRLERLDAVAVAVSELVKTVQSIQQDIQTAKRTDKKRKCDDTTTSKKAHSGALVPTSATGSMTPIYLPGGTPTCAATPDVHMAIANTMTPILPIEHDPDEFN